MSDSPSPFEHTTSFVAGEVSGGVRLGRFEAHYEELFADVIEDGIITPEERAQLDRTATSLGLDPARLQRLEQALTGAYEARHRVRIREVALDEPPSGPSAIASASYRPSLTPLEPSSDLRVNALERKIAALEARIVELEGELDEARDNIAVDLDLSDVSTEAANVTEDADELVRRVRHDPHDADTLHRLYRAFGQRGDLDRQWCTAHVLAHLGAANTAERETFERHRVDGLVRPRAALVRESWSRLLFHPEEEPLVGEIFSVVIGPVLLGRVAALRRDKALLEPNPETRQDPTTSTVQAVRCFVWGAAILGMPLPPIFADPQRPAPAEVAVSMSPGLRLGRQALSGRTPAELAFLAGRHLSAFREEHFIRALLPAIPDLEDIFLGALSIGNPGLPMSAAVKSRVVPIAAAIEPILDPSQIDRLRGQFLRFVEDGGRANLQRWATAVDATAARAGLLLSNDLGSAKAMLALEEPAHAEARMDDLLVFVTSDRYAKLRRQIGIAIEG